MGGKLENKQLINYIAGYVITLGLLNQLWQITMLIQNIIWQVNLLKHRS